MAVDQTTSGRPLRQRLTNDVNGLFFVFGVLAVMMVSLPCPSDASDKTRIQSPQVVSETKR